MVGILILYIKNTHLDGNIGIGLICTKQTSDWKIIKNTKINVLFMENKYRIQMI